MPRPRNPDPTLPKRGNERTREQAKRRMLAYRRRHVDQDAELLRLHQLALALDPEHRKRLAELLAGSDIVRFLLPAAERGTT